MNSKTKFLYEKLIELKYEKATKALECVIRVMNKENGYQRHDGSDYYRRLVDVTQILLNFNVRDENTIVSALLHDYLEDVKGVTLEQIKNDWGNDVAETVKLLSKKKNIDYHKKRK